jgi:hypothetical protein
MALTVSDPAAGPAACSFRMTLPVRMLLMSVVLGAAAPLKVVPPMLSSSRSRSA